MTARDALWLAAGALAYPLGTVIANLIARRSILYPH